MYYADFQLANDRAEQMRSEIQHYRLGAALANNDYFEKAGGARKSLVARVSTIFAALIR